MSFQKKGQEYISTRLSIQILFPTKVDFIKKKICDKSWRVVMVKIKGTWANVCSWWRYVMKLKRQFSLTPNEALNFTLLQICFIHTLQGAIT